MAKTSNQTSKQKAPKLKLRRDDLVEVIAGNDRGKRGKILFVDRVRHRVIVEGVNLRKHHEKVRQTKAGQSGGIEEREVAIDVSNVMIVDPQTGKPARVGIKTKEDGTRVRITKGRNASGSELDG